MWGKKMKICTITHHTVPNYGAVLQAYALQTAIKKLGYDTEILNYEPERVKRFYHQSLTAQNNLKEFLRHLVYWKRFRSRNKPFRDFVQKWLQCSAVYSRKALQKKPPYYDLYISGSDQVWNLALHGNDTTYLLDFVLDNSAKGSYAASFGYAELPQQYIEKTRKYLQDFRYINVREPAGRAIVQNLLGKERTVQCVVDPTFLLERKEWETFVHPVEQNNYILVHEICRLKNSYDYAEQLARKTGKKVVIIQPFDNIKQMRSSNGVEYIFGASPETFLSLIYNADFVVTSSFHATVFSIIFHKRFFCSFTLGPNSTNSRLQGLLALTGLTDRLTGMENYNQPIEYNSVDKCIKAEVEASIQVLRHMIEERKTEIVSE